MRARFTEARLLALLAIVCCFAAAVVVHSPTARIIAKQVCDPIAHATSGGAALFTLAFIAFSSLFLLRSSHVPPQSGMHSERLMLVALIAGNAANVMAHGAALRTLGIPITLPIYQWAGADNTYSYLFHSHAGKAALTSLLSMLAPVLSLDIGQGWGTSLPRWAGPTCGLALAVSLAAYLHALPSLALRFGTNRWLTLLLGLAVLNASKSIIDGGLLSYRAIPSLLVIAALVTCRDAGQWSRRAPAWLAGGSAVLGAYLLLWKYWSPANASEPWQAFASFLALLALPALLAWKPRDAWLENYLRPGLHASLVLIVMSVVAQNYVTDARQGTGMLWRPLNEGYRAVYVDPTTLQVRSWSVAGQRPIDVYRNAGDDALKPKHLLLARAGHAAPAEFAMAVLSGEVGMPTTPREPPWRVNGVGLTGPNDGVRIVSLNAATPLLEGTMAVEGVLAHNNYYCLLHGFSAQLRAAGLASFTLIPLRDRQDLDRVLSGETRRGLSASNLNAR